MNSIFVYADVPLLLPSVKKVTQPIIEEIIVEGAQRVEPSTIKSYLLVRKGDLFNQARLNRSLKSLFATSLFSDVSFSLQKANLIIQVVENPLINRVAFEGNNARTDEELGTEINLRPRVIFTRTKIQNDVERILTIYRRTGRFAAKVEPKLIQLPQNRVDLIFEINEGDITNVESVRFVGNQKINDDTLSSVIKTKESAWWRFLSDDDVYDPDRLNYDIALLRKFYLTEGYADFRVLSSSAELTPNKKRFFITFSINEGKRYRVDNVSVNANLRGLKVEELSDNVIIQKGDWYDVEIVEKVVDKLTHKIGELGHAFVDVRPKIKRDRKTGGINIIFEIKEGPRVFVEKIDISGNVRTMDKVIRREFRIIEGDAFNSSKLRRSKQRIENLGYFEKVNLQNKQGSSKDKAIVKVEVEEKSTGSISVGAGFSSSVGALAEFGISEKNFLGKGQKLNLKTTIASSKSQIDLSFTEPYFLDQDVSSGIDLFHSRQDFQSVSSFDMQRTGLGLRIGYPVNENLRQNWAYLIRKATIKDIDSSASSLIQKTKGTEYLSQLQHVITHDKLDKQLEPTEGYLLALTTSLAGLGGGLQHLNNHIRGQKYYSIADEWVASLSGGAGYVFGIGKDVHLLERFHLGGNNLRGFESRGADPRDTATDDALGGEWIYTGSLQLRFPVGLSKDFGVSGRAFTDLGGIGSLSPTNSTTKDPGSIRLAPGLGLSWRSPMGPILLDFGFPVLKESYDNIEYVRVSFGTRF